MDNMFSSYRPNEDRFSFKSSGTFRCDYKSGLMIQMIITPLAAILALVVYGAGLNMSGKANSGVYEAVLNSVLTSAWVYIALFLILGAWLCTFALINAGQEYSYYADDKQMTIKFPRDSQPQLVIRYDEPVNILYSERFLFNKSQGYNVTLICPRGEFVFMCKHNSASRTRGRKALPFYILEERTGQAIKPEFYVR